MQISINLLRVIFMLSTIVIVTDCCSSRILLLKERTPARVHQHQQQEQEHFQQQLQRPPIYVDSTNIITTSTTTTVENEIEPNSSSEIVNSFNSNPTLFTTTLSLPASSFEAALSTSLNNDEALGISTEEFVLMAAVSENAPTHKPTPPPQPPPIEVLTQNIDENSSPANKENVDTVNASHDAITDPTMREQHAGNPEYRLTDLYYTIMSNILSFQCSGQFLTEFCLNRGRCFRYPVGNHSFFSCECADGYVGERCESKSINGLYVSPKLSELSKQRKILTARIVFSFPVLIIISMLYLFFGAMVVLKKCPRQEQQPQPPHSKQAAGRLVS